MFAIAHKAAKDLISNLKININENLTLPSQCLPKEYSLSQLYDQLFVDYEMGTKEDEVANLIILSSCLTEPSRLNRESSDNEYITKLSLCISKVILPDGNIIPNDDAPEDNSSASRQDATLLAQRKGYLGLQSISLLLLALSIPIPSAIDSQILLSVISFSSPLDPWTTPSTTELSFQLLSKYNSQTHTPAFIVDYLIKSFIRPLFSKSRPSAVTESGRKAMASSAPPKRVDFVAERGQNPWKYEAPYCLSILGWAVEIADESIIKSFWHLFIPPIVTLLDDPSTSARSRGLKILTSFLPKLSAKLLTQTGLASVFEDAITPTLLYLPNLTPIEDTLLLLPAAYTALFTLCDVLFRPSPYPFPNPTKTPQDKTQDTERERLKFLDRITRQGVLVGYTHSSSYPSIVEILVSQLSTLIPRMGIHSVKHLKDILPLLCAILCNPFSCFQRTLLLEALKTMQVLILNTWPRMREEGHRVEVIRALVFCWKSVSDESEGNEGEGKEKELLEAKRQIGVTGKLLVSAVEGDVDMKRELKPVLDIDARLVGEVFGITAEDTATKE